MGYTKKWVPPTIPLRDDLAAWKTLFGDLHQNLLDAGLVQSATSGQLDISTVSLLPADGSFEGFIEYEFDDALQATAPVVIRLEYGCGLEGLSSSSSSSTHRRTRTPRIRATVYFCNAQAAVFECPQGFSPVTVSAGTTQLTEAGSSTLCYSEDDGFFGIVYGAGSRNKPSTNVAGGYFGATFTLFIQRSLDVGGVPTGDALRIYHPYLMTGMAQTGNAWLDAVLPLSQSVFMPNGGVAVSHNGVSPRVGREGLSAGVEEVLFEPIGYPSSPVKQFPFIVSYRHTDMGVSEEFEFQPLVGPPRNFITLGRETCMSIDSVDGQRAGIAMLFE